MAVNRKDVFALHVNNVQLNQDAQGCQNVALIQRGQTQPQRHLQRHAKDLNAAAYALQDKLAS